MVNEHRPRALLQMPTESDRYSVSDIVGPASPASVNGRYVFGEADYPVGNQPSSPVLGDFNGDGILDVAVVSYLDKTISILLGKPDGTFGSASPIAFKSNLGGVAVGDFNRDGKLDLAVVDGQYTLAVLLGNGDGTFQAPVEYATSFMPVAITVADLNKDGKLDLVTANECTPSISVLLGNGDGTFKNHMDYYAAPGGGCGAGFGAVAIADLNGDGNLDLAVPELFAVSVLLGNGDGTFQGFVQYGEEFNEAENVAIGDFNGDHKLDLAVTRQNNNVSILLGNGDGTFPTVTDYSTGPCPTLLVAADLNGDGRLDLAIADQTCGSPRGFGSISVLQGNGDGTFQPHVDYGAGVGPWLAVADFNGDGTLDLAIVSQNCQFFPCGAGQFSILVGKGDGTFPAPATYATPAHATALATADFNGDGKLDLAVGNHNDQDYKTISTLLGNGNGTFQPRMDFVAGGGTYSVVTGDFNRDHRQDVAVANDNESTVSILLGNGDGTLQNHVDYPTGPVPISMVTGDFNNDGKLDLVTAPSLGSSISILLGKGDGTFENHVEFPAGSATIAVAAGDFNGDGNLDLAVTNFNSAGTVSILLGNGDGTFQQPVPFNAGEYPHSVAIGDFNHDGKLDLAVTNYFNSADQINVAVLLGNGDGTFQPHVDYSGGDIPLSVTVADVDGDGNLDLVLPDQDSYIAILFGNGDGTFRNHIDYAHGLEVEAATAGDFAGDGATDVAGADFYPGAVSVLLNIPVIALFPNRLAFGAQYVGIQSPVQKVLLSNPGSAPLQLSGIAASGDFAQTNNCPIAPSTLAPGANCVISVTFTPSMEGERTGTITIGDNALAGLQLISLSGTGVYSQNGYALYDSALGAPKCGLVERSCDSGPSLLLGKDNMSGGAEPNQPNTIHSSCADGTAGTLHVDESIDRIVVLSTNHHPLMGGQIVKVSTTVWAGDPTQDALDLYYTSNANHPAWTYITTLVPNMKGAQTLSTQFRLRGRGLQAVRAGFRKGGTKSSCSTGAYDDHDDLVFATLP